MDQPGDAQRLSFHQYFIGGIQLQEGLDRVRERPLLVADGVDVHDLIHKGVQRLTLAAGRVESNLVFTHASHYPPKTIRVWWAGIVLR